MPEQKKDVKDYAREYLEKLKKEQAELEKSKEKEKNKKPVEDTRMEEERMKSEAKENDKQVTSVKEKIGEKPDEEQGIEDKKLMEDLEKREEEAVKRKEEERKRIELERLAFLKEDEEKANAEKRKIITGAKIEKEKIIEDKNETEDKKLGEDLEKRKEEAIKRKEEERKRIEVERLAFLKEDEERANAEKRRITKEIKTGVKEEEKIVKKEAPKAAGRIGGITKNITAAVMSPLLALVKIIQQILLSINKAVIMVVGVVKNVIGTIIGNIFKVIVTLVTALLPAIKWVVAALVKLFSVTWGVIKGFQDNIINTAASKSKQLAPKKITTRMDGMIMYGGVKKTSSQIISTTAIYAVVFSLFVGAVTYALHFQILLVLGAFIAGFLLIFIIVFIMLNMMADKRAESVDQVLPDILQIVSVNMVAGMTPYNSLLVAARPEFGPLAEEIHKAVQDTLSGKPLIASLEEMSARVRSDKLKRCVKLMVQGMNSGGELSTVLQEIAKDIRYMQNLEKEMKANTTGFSMFILFAIVIGAPLLLGVSITFVEIFSAIFSTIDIGSMGEAAKSSMISLEGLSITPDFFWMYAILVLFISGFFGGLMIGVLQSGKMTSGITMGPVLAAVAILIFVILHNLLISVFGSAIIGA